MSRTIAIVTHEYDKFSTMPYFLPEIAKLWQDAGFKVELVKGAHNRVDADIAILHVDLTVTPQEYADLAQTYPIALNGGVLDISKRAISTNLVERGSYDGPVIIKTNLNNGGLQEKLIAEAKSLGPTVLSSVHISVAFPDSCKLVARNTDYGIFKSASEVPSHVWSDDKFVVERFLPEMQDDLYCLRTWCFLGDAETNSICYARDPLIKPTNVVKREMVPTVPDELRQRREALKFDFGKFDYALVDGSVVLYDTNRTPAYGAFPLQSYMPNLRILSEGIRFYL